MSLKSKFVSAVVLGGILASASLAHAAASVVLSLGYLGSYAGNGNNNVTKLANGAVFSTGFVGGVPTSTLTSGFTQYTPTELSSPAVQGIANLKNYFGVYVHYTPNTVGDVLEGVGFNVNFPAGMVPVSSTGAEDTSTSKWFAYNPTDTANTGHATWDTTGDIGTFNGDLQAISCFQATNSDALLMAIGQTTGGTYGGAIANGDDAGYVAGKGTLIGVFAMAFTSTSASGTITLSEAATGNVKWWLANGSAVIGPQADAALSTNGFNIPSPVSTPEPASLGVLALGGAALLARRRKTA